MLRSCSSKTPKASNSPSKGGLVATPPGPTDQRFLAAMGAVGLVPIWPEPQEETEENLQAYLDSVGPSNSHFKAEELIRGGIPSTPWWPRIALLRWVADQCRNKLPIKVAWVWRPEELNRQVGGAPESSHITCRGIDLDFTTEEDRTFALKTVIEPLYKSPANFGIGYGVGKTRVHIDFFGPKWEKTGRPRWWNYDSAKTYRGPPLLVR